MLTLLNKIHEDSIETKNLVEMKNVTITKIVLLCLLLSLGSACTTTNLLNTEFDNFSTGAIPNVNDTSPVMNIPGEPTDDLIYWSGPPNLGQTFPPFRIEGGVLQYVIDRSNAGNESLLGFLPSNMIFDSGYFNYNWGMEFVPNTRRLINVRLTAGDDYNSDIILDLEIRPIVTTGGGNTRITYAVTIGDGQFLQDFPYRRLEQVGEINSSSANFLISLNIPNNQYLVHFDGFDGAAEFKAFPFNTSRLRNAPSLWFKFAEAGEARGHVNFQKMNINHSIQAD